MEAKSMINCSKCGKELNDGARFCRYCGTPTLSEPAEKNQTDFICPKCGKSVPQTARFCKFCGESLDFSNEKKQEGGDGIAVIFGQRLDLAYLHLGDRAYHIHTYPRHGIR